MKGYVNVSCIFLGRGYLVFIRLSEKLVNLCLIQPSYLADLCILELLGLRLLVYVFIYKRREAWERDRLCLVGN